MGFTLQYRDKLYGAWDTAQGFLVQQLDALVASLTSLGPLQDSLTAPYPASSVLVTDASGTPSWKTTLPVVDVSTRTDRVRADGSTVLPNGLALNVTAQAVVGAIDAQLGVACVITSTGNNSGSGPQALEGYTLLKQPGTTNLGIGTIGNIEHNGTGTTTKIRAAQAGFIISNSGGGTDAACFTAVPSGRAFGGTGTYTNGYGVLVTAFGAGITNKYALYSADAAAGILLSSDVAVKTTTTTWQVSSDARLKRNIQRFTDGLETVDALRPVTYEYNGLGGLPDGLKGIGVVAQEAEPVAPYLIGERQYDGETYKTISDSPLFYVLINAVQELAARVRALEAQECRR